MNSKKSIKTQTAILLDLNHKKIFTKAAIERALNKSIFVECLKNNSLLGELTLPYMNHQHYVDLNNASHRLISHRWDNNILYGEIEILNNKNGDILKKIINNGDFKIRGYYDMETKEVTIITFDFCINEYVGDKA